MPLPFAQLKKGHLGQIRDAIKGLSIHSEHIQMGQLGDIVNNSNFTFADFVTGMGLIEFGTYDKEKDNTTVHLSIKIENTNNGIVAQVRGGDGETQTFTINTVNSCLRDLGFQ